MSDDGYINREMLAERDAAVKMLDAALTRIEALEAALAKADALADILETKGLIEGLDCRTGPALDAYREVRNK